VHQLGRDVLKVLRNLALFAAGLLPAFLIVFTLLISDGGDAREQALGYTLTFLFYLLVAFGVGITWPDEPLSSAMWLLLPATGIALWHVLGGPQDPSADIGQLAAVVLSATVLGAIVGAWAGSRLDRRDEG
jgi:hypothetical protein